MRRLGPAGPPWWPGGVSGLASPWLALPCSWSSFGAAGVGLVRGAFGAGAQAGADGGQLGGGLGAEPGEGLPRLVADPAGLVSGGAAAACAAAVRDCRDQHPDAVTELSACWLEFRRIFAPTGPGRGAPRRPSLADSPGLPRPVDTGHAAPGQGHHGEVHRNRRPCTAPRMTR